MTQNKGIGFHWAFARLAFLSVVLFAVVVSAVIPSGYMPSQGETWTLTICTPDGIQEIAAPVDDPGHNTDGDGAHGACVFASLGQIALHIGDTLLPVIHALPSSEPADWTKRDFAVALHASPVAARAPPTL